MDKNNFSPLELLETVMNQMLEGFQVIDKDWRYVYVNETVAKQGKTTRDHLIGKTMMEIYPGIDQTPLFQSMKKSMEEKVDVSFENEFTYPDNSKGWFQLYIHPWENGVMVLSMDVTKRKLLEEELNETVYELDRISIGMQEDDHKVAEIKATLSKLKGDLMKLDLDPDKKLD